MKQNKNQDLIGDFLSGKSKENLIVHSGIAEPETIPLEYFYRSYEELPEIEKKAIELCKGKILDVGAGAGCHAVILASRGYDVFPVDISNGAVEVMKSRGLVNAQVADFFDMEAVKFDTILLLMNGIGICGSLDRLDSFFNRIRIMLNPRGQVLMDSSDIIYMYEEDDGSLSINLNASYYGEVTYRFQLGKAKGKPFKWLFLDFDLLSDYASRNNCNCEMIMEGDHYDYLARLTLLE